MKISRKIICIMLGLGFAAFGGGAVAGEHQMRQEHHPSAAAGQHQAGQHPGMHAREHNQANRIGQGVRSGQLTKDEARGMAKDQRDIRHEVRGYQADGEFTRKERKDVRQDMNEASRDIYREKHDAEQRPRPEGRPGGVREKIENMSPEQRQAMREKMTGGRDETKRREMRERFEKMSPEERQEFKREMHERMTPEQREKLRERAMDRRGGAGQDS